MMFRQYTTATVLAVALLAVGYGVYQTDSQPAPVRERGSRRTPSDRTIVVDQSSLITAEQLVRMPTTPDERPFAEDALRIADQEMDLAFAHAVRLTLNRPRVATKEAIEAESRLRQSLRALATDQAEVDSLVATLAAAKAEDALSLTDRLNLARAQAALDQDEVDDARLDLRRAGGDPQGRMQQMLEEHEAASTVSDSIHVVVANADESKGLVRLLQSWQATTKKERRVRLAKAEADSLILAFKRRHDRVAERAIARRDSSRARLSHDSSAALLAETERRAHDEKSRATYDQRIDNQNRLSQTYAGWIGVLNTRETMFLNGALRSMMVILAIMLVTSLLTRVIEQLLGARSMDRRRTQTLYMVSRVSLQVTAVLMILLVIFGPPDNLGTILGLAGAGLTVALKDFLVAFLGWFVLMGRNGIRIGDLVEIKGVTGEVVELGVFYTAMLEMGGWNESGHPTGRRVTFTNGFAIEGHYFNFSTTGQWLWDEVRITVPLGHDPHAIAEALLKDAEEETAESAREAELQWREVRRAAKAAAPLGRASVNLKPTSGGVEITVRYITRATDREALRSKLYHTAVELLGSSAVLAKAASVG